MERVARLYKASLLFAVRERLEMGDGGWEMGDGRWGIGDWG